jgi:hypothetical protein
LPETTEEPGGLRFSVNGKQFAWPWMERVDPKKPRVARHDVIAVRVANEMEKASLLAMDQETFFTEPHYNGYPAVLVRLSGHPPRPAGRPADRCMADPRAAPPGVGVRPAQPMTGA